MDRESVQGGDAKPKKDKASIGFIALVLFTCGIIVSPRVMVPSLRALHLQELFAIVAAVGALGKLLGGGKKKTIAQIEVFYTLFFLATALGFLNLSKYGGAETGASLFQNTFKTWLILILLGSYISTYDLFKKGIIWFLFAVAFFEIHGVKAVLSGGGLFAGRFDSWIGLITNSDNVGAFLVMMLPIQMELFVYYTSFFKRYSMLILCFSNIMLMVLTQTRSAFLSFIVVMPLWLIYRKNRGIRLTLFLAIVCLVIAVGSIMTTSTEYSDYFSRMKTIFNSEQYENDANIQSRFLFWEQGLEIWRKFPVIGCGVGGMDFHETLTHTDLGKSYTEGVSLTEYSLHQTFIQILAERGLLGFAFYLLFLYGLYSANRRNIKYVSKQVDLEFHSAVSRGIRLGLIAYFINAQFMNLAEYWVLIVLAGYVAGLKKIIQQKNE